MLLSKNHPLCNVNDVFNAIFVRGNMLGDAMFYGSGAGKLPTASAVVADVVDAAKHLHRTVVTRWESNTLELVPNADAKRRFFVRIHGEESVLKSRVDEVFGQVEFVKADDVEGESLLSQARDRGGVCTEGRRDAGSCEDDPYGRLICICFIGF